MTIPAMFASRHSATIVAPARNLKQKLSESREQRVWSMKSANGRRSNTSVRNPSRLSAFI
jgi:uncharacterized protein YicC (UPF0701 family)